MDYFSKYVEAILLANQEATTIAKALVENVKSSPNFFLIEVEIGIQLTAATEFVT